MTALASQLMPILNMSFPSSAAATNTKQGKV